MRLFFAALACLAGWNAALAQGYPSKPITFVIPFAAGGDSDLSGRNVAQFAPKYLNNQAIVPVNRVGASGVIGAMAVRTAQPDGYTLLVARIATHAVVPALDSKAPYKWNEFTMLSLIELNPYICFVKGDSPHRSAAALMGEIRANPGKLNFSTAGIGTSQNMAVQYWMTLANLTKDHAVGIHYKGGGEVTTAVLGGQVQFACNNAPTVIPHVKSGALRALLVTPERLADLPDVPSAREAGFPDMEKIVGWTALMGPPGLPRDIVERWVEVFAKLAKDPDWQAGNARLGGIAAIRSPADTEKFVREQYELYDKLVSTLGIRQ
ncbi:MAG TPA: tripartite tricarboxylate transporter substrate binding protein [Burkholderiales bacterium]|jgi:tripartite-type tricarboxylate transporter receptor subunit TctC|nr:tripartite tricarboxylate transporter substrate binding protein [Burkholderiales bacterium]